MNKRRREVSLIIAAVSLCLLGFLSASASLAQKAQPKDVSAVVDASPAAWKEFSSTEGRFAIRLPGTPKESTQSLGQMNLRIFQLQSAFEYSVMYADYPEEINDSDPALAKRVLDNGLEGAVAAVNAKLVEVQEVSIGKHPGRQYVEQMPNGTIMRGKTFLVGNRLYQIAITTPKEEGSLAESVRFYRDTAAKYLDSFRLIER